MGADSLEPGDEVTATFSPRRTDDLKPGVAVHIGHRGRWRVMWRVTPEDGGPYVGELAMAPVDHLPPIGWVPLSDLTDVR